MQRSAIIVWLVLSLTFAPRGVCSYQAEARETGKHDAPVTAARQQLAATIAALEITRHHVQLWESNETARTLVTQMMNDIIAPARVNADWQSRFLTPRGEDRDEQQDAFERMAIERLATDGVTVEQVWSRDGNRVVTRVPANKSCTNCHDVKRGNALTYISLRFATGEQQLLLRVPQTPSRSR